MNVVLTSPERDKAVMSLRDIQGVLEYTRKVEYKDLDEIQTILASRGLQIAPIPKAAPLVLTSAPAAPVATSGPAPVLTTNETGWIESVVQMYQQYKRENRKGYVLTLDQLGRLLTYTCRLAKIKFQA